MTGAETSCPAQAAQAAWCPPCCNAYCFVSRTSSVNLTRCPALIPLRCPSTEAHDRPRRQADRPRRRVLHRRQQRQRRQLHPGQRAVHRALHQHIRLSQQLQARACCCLLGAVVSYSSALGAEVWYGPSTLSVQVTAGKSPESIHPSEPAVLTCKHSPGLLARQSPLY